MKRIRQLRTERGLSQAKLAVMADMDPATLNRLEQGKGNPNLRTLERVADALNVSVAELLVQAPKGARRSPQQSFNGLLEERRQHEGLLRAHLAAVALGRTVIESFKNFKPLDIQRLAAFQQLEHGLLMIRGKRDILGNEPEDLAEAIGELEEVSRLVNEMLNEHLDTSPPKEREKFQRELRDLMEQIKV
jgi:transcriptional regulator with XRE-family HTH domain